MTRPVTGPPHDLQIPLYWRMLRLRHVQPNGWQRAVLVEGVFAVAAVLSLADVASAWTILALPLASVVVVKAHDVLVGMLPSTRPRRTVPLPPASMRDYAPLALAVLAFVVLRVLVHGTVSRVLAALALVAVFAVARWLYRDLLPGRSG